LRPAGVEASSEGRVNVSLSFQAASTTESVSPNIANFVTTDGIAEGELANEGGEVKQRGDKMEAQKKTPTVLFHPGGVSAGFFERINHESGNFRKFPIH